MKAVPTLMICLAFVLVFLGQIPATQGKIDLTKIGDIFWCKIDNLNITMYEILTYNYTIHDFKSLYIKVIFKK